MTINRTVGSEEVKTEMSKSSVEFWNPTKDRKEVSPLSKKTRIVEEISNLATTGGKGTLKKRGRRPRGTLVNSG